MPIQSVIIALGQQKYCLDKAAAASNLYAPFSTFQKNTSALCFHEKIWAYIPKISFFRTLNIMPIKNIYANSIEIEDQIG